MDYRSIVAIGFLVLSGAIFLHSQATANALPIGPNVSLGSNPIQSWSGRRNSGWVTLDTLQNDFVITDLVVSGTGEFCTTALSSQNVDAYTDILFSGSYKSFSQNYGQGNTQFNGNLRSGVHITAGTTLYAYIESNGICNYTVSGYYTH